MTLFLIHSIYFLRNYHYLLIAFKTIIHHALPTILTADLK